MIQMARYHRTSGSSRSYRPVMIFIDGGYLREGFKKIIGREIGEDTKDFTNLQRNLMRYVVFDNIVGELIRVYYYDAIVDPTDDLETYNKQKEYFDKIRKCNFYEVRLGRRIKTPEGNRQKGVDILLAIEMLTKAFQDHYEIAAFLGGDDDFIDLINSVKELTGKRIYGFFFQHNASERLLKAFDSKLDLSYNLPKWFKT